MTFQGKEEWRTTLFATRSSDAMAGHLLIRTRHAHPPLHAVPPVFRSPWSWMMEPQQPCGAGSAVKADARSLYWCGAYRTCLQPFYNLSSTALLHPLLVIFKATLGASSLWSQRTTWQAMLSPLKMFHLVMARRDGMDKIQSQERLMKGSFGYGQAV